MLEDTDLVIFSLNDFSDYPVIEEDGETFFENALKKAKTIANVVGEIVLADDSGLEVDHLDGKPGVKSSRYSGYNATDNNNITKLLDELRDIPIEKRGASFRCVLVLFTPDGWFESFEGSLRGRITEQPAGDCGFGYDPVFFVPEKGMTVAQLPPETKNRISHRAEAAKKLKKWLQEERIAERKD